MNHIREFIHNEEFVNPQKETLMAAHILIDDLYRKIPRISDEITVAAGLKKMWAERINKMNARGESSMTAAYEEALDTDEATLTAATVEIIEEMKSELVRLLKSGELVPPDTEDVIKQICFRVMRRGKLIYDKWRTNNCIVNAIGIVLLGEQGLYDLESTEQKKSLVNNDIPDLVDINTQLEEVKNATPETKLTEEHKLELSSRDIRMALYNITEVRDNIAARGNREATYATLFRHKLKTAQVAAPNYLSESYKQAITMTDYEIGRLINTLINRIDDYLRTSSTVHTTTEDLLTDLIVHLDSFEFKFRQKSLAVLREFCKVLVSDGRLFMFNMVPEDEYPEFEPRLVAVDRLFDKIYTTETVTEA